MKHIFKGQSIVWHPYAFNLRIMVAGTVVVKVTIKDATWIGKWNPLAMALQLMKIQSKSFPFRQSLKAS